MGKSIKDIVRERHSSWRTAPGELDRFNYQRDDMTMDERLEAISRGVRDGTDYLIAREKDRRRRRFSRWGVTIKLIAFELARRIITGSYR